MGEKLMLGCVGALAGALVGGVLGTVVGFLTTSPNELLRDVAIEGDAIVGALIGAALPPLTALVWAAATALRARRALVADCRPQNEASLR